MGAHLSLLPKNFKGETYRSTDGTIFACVEGKGATKVGNETLEWGPRDVFVIPSWKRLFAQGRGRERAVLDLRPAGAGIARHLARR